MNGYTGKTNGVSFRLSAGTRRQAREYLLSRGFDKAANEKLQCDAFALAWRDGGTYDLGQLSAKAAFSARTTERAFNRLVTGGLCDVDPAAAKPRLARLRLALPVVKGYYGSSDCRYVRIEDVRPNEGKSSGPTRRRAVPKWFVGRSEGGILSFVPVGCPELLVAVILQEVAWKHFAKLRSVEGGAL